MKWNELEIPAARARKPLRCKCCIYTECSGKAYIRRWMNAFSPPTQSEASNHVDC
jgi:hypothetical protein